MAGQKFVFALIFFIAIAGSVSDLGETAYGESPWEVGQQPDSSPDNGGLVDTILGGIGSVIGGALDVVSDFFSAIIPSLTGIWIIDNWLINPLGVFAGYKAIVLARGGGG